MLKRERHHWILSKVNQQGVLSVNDIIKFLKVSDMTVRRDLDELDKEGLLIRIHGGAQSLDFQKDKTQLERSNSEKQELQIEEKQEIAQFAAQFVEDGETIFIGPGTTLEHFADELAAKNIRVVTNSLPVFSILKENKNTDLILTGGEYREITGAFVGSLTTSYLQNIKFSKAFVSSNAVFGNYIATYSEAEGEIQKLALDNAIEKFLLVDHEKFNKYDFYDFYPVSKIDYIITDAKISQENKDKYKSSHILVAKSGIKN